MHKCPERITASRRTLTQPLRSFYNAQTGLFVPLLTQITLLSPASRPAAVHPRHWCQTPEHSANIATQPTSRRGTLQYHSTYLKGFNVHWGTDHPLRFATAAVQRYDRPCHHDSRGTPNLERQRCLSKQARTLDLATVSVDKTVRHARTSIDRAVDFCPGCSPPCDGLRRTALDKKSVRASNAIKMRKRSHMMRSMEDPWAATMGDRSRPAANHANTAQRRHSVLPQRFQNRCGVYLYDWSSLLRSLQRLWEEDTTRVDMPLQVA